MKQKEDKNFILKKKLKKCFLRMTYIKYEQKAIDFLNKIEKQEANRIFNKMRIISQNVKRHLEGLKNIDENKIRIGDYRLFVEYEPLEDILKVYTIKHRKNAYK